MEETHSVCPWWMGYLLVSPLRRLAQNPKAIVGPYVREGMTVLEPGPGMGFFTLEIAKLVGSSGRVVAVDVQAEMLQRLRRRAERAGVAGRVETRLAPANTLGVRDLEEKADFILAFAVVHELPDSGRFFTETAPVLKAGGTFLLAEPSGHVSEARFAEELDQARRAGLVVESNPVIRGNHAAVLKRTQGRHTP